MCFVFGPHSNHIGAQSVFSKPPRHSPAVCPAHRTAASACLLSRPAAILALGVLVGRGRITPYPKNVATRHLGPVPRSHDDHGLLLPMASRPIQVDDAIDYLVHSQTDITSVQQFRKKLEQESGGPGRRYLGTLREWEVEGLFDQFKTLKQGNACLSPAESHADHELLPDHIDSTESLGAAGGRPFVIIPGPSNQQRHGAREDVFYIELMAAQHQAPGRNIVRSAKRNSQCAHSIIDRPTAAVFLGWTEGAVEAITEVRLRWRTYHGGQDKGRIRKTLCRIEHVDGANVVFSEKDLSDQGLGERGEDDDDDDDEDDEGEEKGKTVMDMVARMNAASALKLYEESRKRSSTARGHDDPQRKRTKH